MRQHAILFACLGLGCAACQIDDTDDEGGPGTVELDLGTGKDTFWIDTDGVSPEIPGCHVEYADSDCTTVATAGRNFGEYCMDTRTLVESNPGAHVCHTHEKDVGHRYVVDCVAWCTNKYAMPNGQRRGVVSSTGVCMVVPDVACNPGLVQSAQCLCR
jgi:hypothetical protein